MDYFPTESAPSGIAGGEIFRRDRRKDRLVRLRCVIERTGLSRTTIYRRELRGEFPKREQLGTRCIAWYESDMDDFVANPMGYRAL